MFARDAAPLEPLCGFRTSALIALAGARDAMFMQVMRRMM